MRFARHLLWILPVGLSLSVASAEPSSPYRIFKPGPVTPTGNNKFLLTGSFTVASDPVFAAIQDTSHGSGGACIIADLAKHGAPELSCTSNTQCSQAWVAYNQANLGNPNYDAAAFGVTPAGYCVANRCWYRPADAACFRRPFPNVWEVGHHKLGPIDFGHVARMYGEDTRINWRVLTCANRAQPNGTDAPSCAQSTGIYDPPVDAPVKNKATDWESKIHSAPE